MVTLPDAGNSKLSVMLAGLGYTLIPVVPDVPLQRASGTTNKADLQSAASQGRQHVQGNTSGHN